MSSNKQTPSLDQGLQKASAKGGVKESFFWSWEQIMRVDISQSIVLAVTFFKD